MDSLSDGYRSPFDNWHLDNPLNTNNEANYLNASNDDSEFCESPPFLISTFPPLEMTVFERRSPSISPLTTTKLEEFNQPSPPIIKEELHAPYRRPQRELKRRVAPVPPTIETLSKLESLMLAEMLLGVAATPQKDLEKLITTSYSKKMVVRVGEYLLTVGRDIAADEPTQNKKSKIKI